ncbi:GNAT family N-acetyltransferase [Raineyella fluvialis]|uniref:GNAT family N-acetyltransferase n=1 Tax=Raineyella fluvialis TaxID=2662261 RepID=A0A5Q2FBD6_9ACTN|nr:GNAT family N-acetyltransferase [Raineyella fluvialis]QGF23037.1 GNAT family N-acetyltransferase [Raineyella fluvialis]
MQVRNATAMDVPEIVRLKALILTSSYPFDVRLDEHPDWPQRAAAGITDMLEHPDYTFFVIDEEPGRLAGCISAGITHHVPGPEWGARHAYIADMCTDEPYRGQGLGRALMQAALDWCRQHGAQSARLDATPGAVEVYRRFGFDLRADELFPAMRVLL